MTKQEFIEGYAKRSEMTVVQFYEFDLDAYPCNCGEDNCKGWQVQHKETAPQGTHRGAKYVSKQEEIREGIAERLWTFAFKRSACNLSNREWSGLPDGAEKRLSRAMAKEIMGYEDSQGVVIKAEKGFPIPYTPVDAEQNMNTDFALGAKRQREIIKEAGYVAVEPLIKEIE